MPATLDKNRDAIVSYGLKPPRHPVQAAKSAEYLARGTPQTFVAVEGAFGSKH